jgi:hypothetical protein
MHGESETRFVRVLDQVILPAVAAQGHGAIYSNRQPGRRLGACRLALSSLLI